ncbi:uncharacterized protein TNCV_1350961 [Trichonephila clavipes]|nr:uncharacterized protein TNCV_1350961 [Trichonephila clavipes]
MTESTPSKYEKNPFAIPDPYYLPGYTGHCPAYKEIVGQSFGRATHDLIESLPSPPGRLKLSTLEKEKAPDEDDLEILEKRKSEVKSVLTKDITPGYQDETKFRYNIAFSLRYNCRTFPWSLTTPTRKYEFETHFVDVTEPLTEQQRKLFELGEDSTLKLSFDGKNESMAAQAFRNPFL